VGAIREKAPFEKPALKPYRGKPAVRNFRGDDGNVGIIRSPVRAIALPDRAEKVIKTLCALQDAEKLLAMRFCVGRPPASPTHGG